MIKTMNSFIITLLAAILASICLTQLCAGRMAGGWTPVATDSSDVRNLTDFAVDMYNKRSNAINYKTLIRIKDAKQQVVAGRKINITFVIAETNCSKNGNQLTLTDVKDCPITNTNTVETCAVTIWERVWLNSTQLLDISCN